MSRGRPTSNERAVLKKARLSVGLTMRRAAKLAGFSHATVSMLEAGKLDSPAAIGRLMAVYGPEHEKLLDKLGVCWRCLGTGKVDRLPDKLYMSDVAKLARVAKAAKEEANVLFGRAHFNKKRKRKKLHSLP